MSLRSALSRISPLRRTPGALAVALLISGETALAQTAPVPAPASWESSIKFGAQLDAGFTWNPQRPADGLNFGHLFTDRANQVLLNQLLLTVERDVPADATGWDWGFRLQGMYGSDARYTHFLGEFDRVTSDRLQFDIVEADIAVHAPLLFAGGIDAKIGQYPTPLGYEVIDPKGNPFYSHSYIFNFGLPFKHTGILTTSHVSPLLDVYLGVDSGTNTSLGGDNNDRPAGIVGFGLNNLLDGKLTVLALSHMGPEDPTRSTPFGNSAMRYYNDVVLTYKPADRLTLVTELNYAREEGFHAEAYGAAQYASYAVNDSLTLNGRAEIFRDSKNFFVAAYPGNLEAVNALGGYPAAVVTAPAPATYGEITLGATFRPAAGPLPTFLIRPELRYDHTLNGVHAYNAGRSTGAFTAALDAILGF